MLKKKIESEKNKHLADIAFVLRKQEDFLKVKEMVTKAEQSYNRILGYSQSEDENTDYWKNQLPVYQKSIDNAKAEVQKTIELLSEKGVSVVEIETQTKNTEDKIAELDKRLESLEVLKLDLVNLYKNEKEERLLSNQHKNYFDERAFENEVLYKSLNRKDFKNNMSSNLPLKKEDHNLSRVISTNRKR